MQLAKKNYAYLKDALYHGKLPNGLSVVLLPKPGFKETYGILSVDFGAMDTLYCSPKSQEEIAFPAGIAHFLEHKLFEKADGSDSLEDFAKIGANANAYTSFHQTCYLFSTTESVSEALHVLLQLVSRADFSEESIEREKGIITQEIEMYQDDPDSRLYAEILASLYPETPLANDIAGTVTSIMAITPQMLYQNFELFYQPEKMSLFLVGDMDVEGIWQQLLEEQTLFKTSDKAICERSAVGLQPVLSHRSLALEVASPKLAVGFRGNTDLSQLDEKELQRYRVSLSLFFSLLIGWTSHSYQDLYEDGKVDSSFSLHLEVHPQYHFLVMTMDTIEPITVSHRLRNIIMEYEKNPDMNQEHLKLLKKDAYGDFIRGLNSLELLASQFVANQTEFDVPEILQFITLEDVKEAGHRFISSSDWTDFTIFPK